MTIEIGQEYKLDNDITITIDNLIKDTVHFWTYYSNGRRIINKMAMPEFEFYLLSNGAKLVEIAS